MEPSLQQLDRRQHAVVLRNVDVVRRARQVVLDRGRGFGGRGRGRERGDLQQLVDRCRFVLLLRESVALRERRDFVGVDAIDEPVEVLAEPRIGPGAVGGLEQDVDGAVEFGARAFEVADLQLAFAGFEVLRGRRDQGGHRIGWRLEGGGNRLDRFLHRRCGVRILLRLGITCTGGRRDSNGRQHRQPDL